MTPPPDPDKPESIVLQQFGGLKNTVAPERLGPADLERAINIDLDDVGMPRRRRGYELRSAGNFHSVQRAGDVVYGVKNGSLGIIYPDYSFTAITPAGPGRISYTTIGEQTYFSSATHSGILTPDGGFLPWGAVSAESTWLSPVVRPTDTLGAIRGKLLGPPPMATEIEHYRGRIYLAQERVVWATELYLYDYVDKTKNFLPFEHDVTMLAAVDDGVFVGTEGGVDFLAGVFGSMQRTGVMSAKVLPGSMTRVPAEKVHPEARQRAVPAGHAVVFMTDAGICAGFSGGSCFNLTQGRVEFPAAVAAASVYREDSGASSYVAVVDSAGSPSANARIGDYVDAEIVRHQG